jgi:hypothetical protein
MSFRPRVITSTDPAAHDEAEPRPHGTPPRARPSDRLEPWSASAGARARVAEASRKENVSFDVAAIVIVERFLIARDLSIRGLASLASTLDERASTTKVELALSEPQRAYLRVLCSRPTAPLSTDTPHLVAIPMRLTERINAEALDELLQVELLASALIWERAAVATGRTMSEWAALTAADVLA